MRKRKSGKSAFGNRRLEIMVIWCAAHMMCGKAAFTVWNLGSEIGEI